MVGHSAGETVDVIVTFPEDTKQLLQVKKRNSLTTIHEVSKRSTSSWRWCKDIDEEVEALDELKKIPQRIGSNWEAYNDAVEAAAIDLAVETFEIVDLQKKWSWKKKYRSINEFLGNSNRVSPPEMYFQIHWNNSRRSSANNTKQKLEAIATKPCGLNGSESRRLRSNEEEINAEIRTIGGRLQHASWTNSQPSFTRNVETWHHSEEKRWTWSQAQQKVKIIWS